MANSPFPGWFAEGEESPNIMDVTKLAWSCRSNSLELVQGHAWPDIFKLLSNSCKKKPGISGESRWLEATTCCLFLWNFTNWLDLDDIISELQVSRPADLAMSIPRKSCLADPPISLLTINQKGQLPKPWWNLSSSSKDLRMYIPDNEHIQHETVVFVRGKRLLLTQAQRFTLYCPAELLWLFFDTLGLSRM